MPVLSTAFTHVHTAVSPVTCGSGTLQPNHTLVLVHVMACDYTSYDFSTHTVDGHTFTQDSNRNAFNGLGNPALRMHTLSYINDTGIAIDLTNAITLAYSGSGVRELATSIRAFTIDAPMEASNSATWALAGNVSPNIVGFASTITEIAIGSISAYEDILAYSWVDGSSNYQTAHAAVGGNVPVTGPESWIQAFDYIGVPDEGGGAVTLSLSGSTTSDTNVAAIVSYLEKQVEFGSISTMPMTLQLGVRDIPEPPAAPIITELVQRYTLGYFGMELRQPWKRPIFGEIEQGYGSLQTIANEVLRAVYKMGRDDASMYLDQDYTAILEATIVQTYDSLTLVSMELSGEYKMGRDTASMDIEQIYSANIEARLNQPYGSLVSVVGDLSGSYKLGRDSAGMSLEQGYAARIEARVDQPYGSLVRTAGELSGSYKMGREEVSSEIIQPYVQALSMALEQSFGSLEPVAADVVQEYTVSIAVGGELTALYSLTGGSTIAMELSSHYTMYRSSDVVVINANSGLTYMPGYTIEPGA